VLSGASGSGPNPAPTKGNIRRPKAIPLGNVPAVPTPTATVTPHSMPSDARDPARSDNTPASPPSQYPINTPSAASAAVSDHTIIGMGCAPATDSPKRVAVKEARAVGSGVKGLGFRV
jgi:hypothetical protein